jgi:hypothetical protein
VVAKRKPSLRNTTSLQRRDSAAVRETQSCPQVHSGSCQLLTRTRAAARFVRQPPRIGAAPAFAAVRARHAGRRARSPSGRGASAPRVWRLLHPADVTVRMRPAPSSTSGRCRLSAASSGSRSRCITTTMVARTSMPGTGMGARESGSTRSRSSTAALASGSCGWFSHGGSFIARSRLITGVEHGAHETLNNIEPLQ